MKFLKELNLNGIAIAVFLAILVSCASSFHEQTMECYEEYSSKLDACNGNEGCESDAVDYFQSCVGIEYVFPVNFIVLTDSLKGTNREVKKELDDVIDTLNRYFTVQDNSLPPDNRKRVVSFTFKSATYFSEAKFSGGDLFQFAQPNFNFDDRHDFRDFVNNSLYSNIVATDAINVFIVDCWGTDDGVYEDIVDSHAKNNDDQPYMVVDYSRITGKSKRSAVEEHEMGHCFNLAHVCDPNAGKNSSTNVMATSGKYPSDNTYEYSDVANAKCTGGSGGLRDIGFNAEQCRIILKNAEEIKVILGF